MNCLGYDKDKKIEINEEDISYKIKDDVMRTKKCNIQLYDELCKTLTDFENATDDSNDEGYLSDGEWLDVLYDLCVKLQREME